MHLSIASLTALLRGGRGSIDARIAEASAGSPAQRAAQPSRGGGASADARALLRAALTVVAIGGLCSCWSPTLVTGPEPVDAADAGPDADDADDANATDAALMRSGPPLSDGGLDGAATSTGAVTLLVDGG